MPVIEGNTQSITVTKDNTQANTVADSTKHKRKMWSVQEKEAVERQLNKFIFLDRLPGKFEIVEAQKKKNLSS